MELRFLKSFDMLWKHTLLYLSLISLFTRKYDRRYRLLICMWKALSNQILCFIFDLVFDSDSWPLILAIKCRKLRWWIHLCGSRESALRAHQLQGRLALCPGQEEQEDGRSGRAEAKVVRCSLEHQLSFAVHFGQF